MTALILAPIELFRYMGSKELEAAKHRHWASHIWPANTHENRMFHCQHFLQAGFGDGGSLLICNQLPGYFVSPHAPHRGNGAHLKVPAWDGGGKTHSDIQCWAYARVVVVPRPWLSSGVLPSRVIPVS